MNEQPYSPLFGVSQRTQPALPEAERALLGAILANNRAYDQVSRFLKPEHFADAINASIFQAIARHVEAGQHTDAITLRVEFENAGILNDVGGVAYLVELLASMIGIDTVSGYGHAIHDCWARRQIIVLGTNLVDRAFGSDPDLMAADVAQSAIDELATINQAIALDITPDFATAARTVSDRAEAAFRGDSGSERLDTGIDSIDRLWNGLWPGRLYYLMARSRSGKTPAMLQFCRHIARGLKAGEHVHVFSLEMPIEDLVVINVAGESKWSADDIRGGQIGDSADWVELDAVSKRIAALPIIVDDGRFTFPGLAVRARQIHRQKHTRLICVDYMDLVRRSDGQTRMGLAEWVPHLGYEFKGLAKELMVPIIVLRQVNKARDSADSTRPTLTDLPYDGGQAADEVHALYRRELDMPIEAPGLKFLKDAEKRAQASWEWEQQRAVAAGQAEFIALKRRFGPLGIASLRFEGRSMSLREIDLGVAHG